MKKRRWGLVGVMLCMNAGASLAQHTTVTQPPRTEEPQRTTATYNDWVVQCDSPAQPSHRKTCEMVQGTQLQGQNLPFSRVAVLQPEKGHPVRLIIQVPVNASFSRNVRIQINDVDSGIAAPFARCVPSGCFADFDITEEASEKTARRFGRR